MWKISKRAYEFTCEGICHDCLESCNNDPHSECELGEYIARMEDLLEDDIIR